MPAWTPYQWAQRLWTVAVVAGGAGLSVYAGWKNCVDAGPNCDGGVVTGFFLVVAFVAWLIGLLVIWLATLVLRAVFRSRC
jgi:hypothetical protein